MLEYTNVFDIIKESVVCVAENEQKTFSNGEEAKAYYTDMPGKFSVQNICSKDGVLTLELKDIIAEIEAANREFVESYKEQNGVEPSFF